MAQLHITPRRIAPYLISGATGIHILARLRYATKQPAKDAPLHFFLLNHTDIVLTLSGASIVLWQIAQHNPRQTRADSSNGSSAHTTNASLIGSVVHELRQIFTSLLLGLGLIKRKANNANTQAIPDIVQRLNAVVRRGMEAVDTLESSGSPDGQEREYGGSA